MCGVKRFVHVSTDEVYGERHEGGVRNTTLWVRPLATLAWDPGSPRRYPPQPVGGKSAGGGGTVRVG